MRENIPEIWVLKYLLLVEDVDGSFVPVLASDWKMNIFVGEKAYLSYSTREGLKSFCYSRYFDRSGSFVHLFIRLVMHMVTMGSRHRE